MICARRKLKPRILQLALRGGGGGRKSLWVPLVLRWRRRRTARREAVAARKSSPETPASLTHNYFYTVTHANGPHRRQPAVPVFPTTTIYRERVTPHRGWANSVTIQNTSISPRSSSSTTFTALSINRSRMMLQRTAVTRLTINRTAQRQHVRHRSSLNYVYRQTPPGLVVERTESRTYFQSPERLPGHQPRASLMKQLPPALRVATRREETPRFVKTQLRTREYQPLVLALRAPIPEPLVPARSSAQSSTRIQFDVAEELVWRRTQTPATKFESGGGADGLTARREPVRTVVEETPAQAATAATTRVTPQQITKLDPALVDRLTDDVIRRVEQRARIERQRRGL
jgi:hypothetical protein